MDLDAFYAGGTHNRVPARLSNPSVLSTSLFTHLAPPLLEFDLDEQNEANERHDHKESQEDAHVEIFRGLLWKRRNTHMSNKLVDEGYSSSVFTSDSGCFCSSRLPFYAN